MASSSLGALPVTFWPLPCNVPLALIRSGEADQKGAGHQESILYKYIARQVSLSNRYTLALVSVRLPFIRHIFVHSILWLPSLQSLNPNTLVGGTTTWDR